MSKNLTVLAVLTFAWLICMPAALAQVTGSVKGVCKDTQGVPITGATVEWYSPETGRKYDLKTDNKGQYFSLGINPGKYNVSLKKDGKELYHFNGVTVSVDEMTLDFDLKKELAAQAQGQGVSQEELKRRQEATEKQAKENNLVKALNEKLAEATQASQAGNYDAAIASLNEATQMDPSRDLLWFKLADMYRSSATKQADPAEKTKRLDQAVADYQKAIQLKQNSPENAKDPDANKKIAAYYNNLAEALAKDNKTDDAVKAYNQAAQLDPTAAGQYYFNEGAIMTNTGKVDDAIAAFDKAIAADPNKADAYYWKGVNLMGKATLKGDKMIAPEGTAEAFNKYLELQPTGQFADPAKQMLASIGASIETTYGTKKKTSKK